MADSDLGAIVPPEPFRASSVSQHRAGSRLGAPPGRLELGLPDAPGQAHLADAARYLRPGRHLLPDAGADAAVQGRRCEPWLPDCSIRLLRGGDRNLCLVRRASSAADVLDRSAVHLVHRDLPHPQHRRTFRYRGPRERLRTDEINPRVRARARLHCVEERQLPHRASLLPERPLLPFAGAPSRVDVEGGVQGFRSCDAQLLWRAPRMSWRRAFVGGRSQANPPDASEPRASLIAIEAEVLCSKKRRRTFGSAAAMSAKIVAWQL